MKREIRVLVLQDRSVGLESQIDELRRLQVFALFTYAASVPELDESIARRRPDVILLVVDCFPVSYDDLRWQLREIVPEIPIIIITKDGEESFGMEQLRKGAAGFVEISKVDRLAPAIEHALRESRLRQELEFARVAARQGSVPAPVLTELDPSASLIASLVDIVTELDMIGTILFESPSVEPVLAWKPEDLVGRNAFSLIHPLDVPKVMPVFMLALATPGVPHSARFRFKHKDGTWRTLEAVGKSIVTDGGARRIIVTSRDITNRVRSHIELGQSEDRFMALIDGLGEGILLTDASDKILYANQRMAEITGYAVSELLGNISYQLFLPEAHWSAYRQQKEQWLLGSRSEYELSIPRKDGVGICTHINVSPYRDQDDRIIGTLAAFTDITHRKEAEDEVQRAFAQLERRVEERTRELKEAEAALQQSHALLEKRVEERTRELVRANQVLEREIQERRLIEGELRAARDRSEEMNRLKTSFLANMSHEVRTPLTSILGFASILSESLEGMEQEEYARLIERSGRRLLETMNGILDLAKVEAQKVEFAPAPLHVDEEIDKVIDMFRPQLAEKSLRITVDSPSPLKASLDSHYLGRVLINLIGNAIKFTSDGGIHITASYASLDGFIDIEIADTGIGISADFLPHIFEEFRQESVGWSRHYEGTGLGLTISKRLIEMMGGSLAVESVKGKGSCFTITLPVEQRITSGNAATLSTPRLMQAA